MNCSISIRFAAMCAVSSRSATFIIRLLPRSNTRTLSEGEAKTILIWVSETPGLGLGKAGRTSDGPTQ